MQPLEVLAHGHLGPDANEDLRTAELFGNQTAEVPQASEPFGSEIPDASEAFGNGRSVDSKSSEAFRNTEPDLPSSSEAFGSEPVGDRRSSAEPDIAAERFGNRSFVQRRADHTLTIKEVVKQFEAAGVARTERSVVNWCQPNKDGVARLDAYFDPNERRYFIAPNSVAHAIEEEKQKLARAQSPTPAGAETTTPVSATFRNEPITEPRSSEPFGNEVSNASEAFRSAPVADHRSFGTVPQDAEKSTDRVRELEREVMDLKITNRAKDMFIEQLKDERKADVNKLVLFSRKIGQLSNRLLQLGAPKEEVENASSLDDERSHVE